MTRRERMTARLERRNEWAGKALAASAVAGALASEIISHIPMGQPILVGHHSERHHRRDLDRVDAAMSRAVERSRMADRHEAVAATLERTLDRSIFSDDDNAADALRARIADLEAQRARVVALNKLIRRELKGGLTPGWLDRIGATEGERRDILSNVQAWRSPVFPSYATANIGGRIAADKKRIAEIEYQAKQRADAEAAPNGVCIKGTDYVAVTFAEKPARDVLDALKAAGFHWSGGSWCGYRAKLPEAVTGLLA